MSKKSRDRDAERRGLGPREAAKLAPPPRAPTRPPARVPVRAPTRPPARVPVRAPSRPPSRLPNGVSVSPSGKVTLRPKETMAERLAGYDPFSSNSGPSRPDKPKPPKPPKGKPPKKPPVTPVPSAAGRSRSQGLLPKLQPMKPPAPFKAGAVGSARATRRTIKVPSFEAVSKLATKEDYVKFLRVVKEMEDEPPRCKDRPSDNKPRGGGGGPRRFIPWC